MFICRVCVAWLCGVSNVACLCGVSNVACLCGVSVLRVQCGVSVWRVIGECLLRVWCGVYGVPRCCVSVVYLYDVPVACLWRIPAIWYMTL